MHILVVGVAHADGFREILARDLYHLIVVVDIPTALDRLADSPVDLIGKFDTIS